MLFAEPVKIYPFALYEQASSNIIIDGVSTKYALGVAGISLQKNLNDKVTLAGKLGYGQNNDQKVSFSGANFKGLVSGSANSMMRSADPAVVVLLVQFQQGLRSRQCKTAGIHGGNCECVQACR